MVVEPWTLNVETKGPGPSLLLCTLALYADRPNIPRPAAHCPPAFPVLHPAPQGSRGASVAPGARHSGTFACRSPAPPKTALRVPVRSHAVCIFNPAGTHGG